MNTIQEVELYTEKGLVKAKGLISINSKNVKFDTVVKNTEIIENARLNSNAQLFKKDYTKFEESLTQDILLDIISKNLN